MSKFVFVGGSGHSGTTLLTAMLGAHSKIYSIPEETYVFRKGLSQTEIRQILTEYSQQCDKPDVEYICEKSPSHIRKCRNIFKVYPDAKFVAIVREPCDVVASFMRRGVALSNAIANWKSAYSSLAEWNELKFPILTVRFEQLVTDASAALSEISEFLALPYESSMLEYWKDPRSYQGVTELQKPDTVTGYNHRVYRNWQIHQPVMNDRIGTYRGQLSEADLNAVRSSLSQLASSFGYDIGEAEVGSPSSNVSQDKGRNRRRRLRDFNPL